jgi:hypothetical protein
LPVALGGGSAAVRTEWTEKDVVVLGDCIKVRFTFNFEDKVFLDFLSGPSSGEDFDLSSFRSKVSLDATDNGARVATDVFREGRSGGWVDDNCVL